MKQIFLAVGLGAMLMAGEVQRAEAHGGIGIAAGIIGGVAGGAIIAGSILGPPGYYAPAPQYYSPAPP